MKITAEPRSDQWNADDFMGGPRSFTIAAVHEGKAEQKYDIELAEGEGRVWRPPLTMLRLLIAAWGDESSEWVGRVVTLHRDETVRFGSDQVGGIRVSHMSHLPGDRPFEVMLTSTRGRRARVHVEPLSRADALRVEWRRADPKRRAEIEAEISGRPAPTQDTEPEVVTDDTDEPDPTLEADWSES